MHLPIIGYAYVHINTYEAKEKESRLIVGSRTLPKVINRSTDKHRVGVQAKAVKLGRLLRQRAGF
jgi:hypothetical protein